MALMAVYCWEVRGAVLRAAHHAVAEGHTQDQGRGRAHGRHRGRGRGKQATMSKERQEALQKVSNSLGEVIEVLSTMLTEFAEQEVEDKENWEKYSKWSDDSETEKNNFIQDQSALIMAKEAQENANKQMVQKLTEDISQLATDIGETEASIVELVKMRKEEKKQFEEGMADITKTIKAVTKATEILESHYSAGGAELEQIRSRVQLALATYGFHIHSATQDKMNTLFSLLQDGSGSESQAPDFLNTDGSKYESYEPKGGGVVGMLTDLRDQLESQREAMVAKETESNQQFQQTKLAKEADLAHMKKTKSDKETQKTECEAIIQECQSTIAQATKEIADARAYLTVLLGDREKFSKAFSERTTMRKAEQAATQAALDALQAVSAGAKEAVEARSPGAASLIQISRKTEEMRTSRRVSVSAKVAKKISHQLAKMVALGKELRSEVLVKMAQKLKDDYMTSDQASFYDAGAFGPVMKLLSDLISRLEEEAAAETSQHDWCEAEKKGGTENQASREKALRGLQASVESFTTQIAQLKTEVLALEAEIARVQEETRIAKEIRAQEHAVFVQAKKDHDEVIGAIQIALQALGGQYSLVEVKVEHHHKQPFEAGGSMPFQKYSSGSGGAASAMEMLEDLEGRYSAALSEIVSDENNAQKMHEDLLARNAQFIAETTNTRNAKVSERRAAIVELNDDKAEVKTNLIELHQVSKYLQDLRPSCDDIRSTYEERKRRREAEIAALKEALEVLSDPSSMS